MKNKAFILTLSAAATALTLNAAIPGQWRLHPTFDNSVTEVIDTPTRTWFTGYPQTVNPALSYKSSTAQSLFFLDKESDEILPAATAYDMISPMVSYIAYNPHKGYMFVAYEDDNIDLLHDSGETENIAVIRNANIAGSKKINNVTFDPAQNLIWVATDFGYVAINDERLEVAESRNYGVPFRFASRFGDNIWLVTEEDHPRAMSAPRSDSRTRLTAYTPDTTLDEVSGIATLSDGKVVMAGLTYTYDESARPDSGEEAPVPTGKQPKLASYDVSSGTPVTIWERDLNEIGSLTPAKNGYVATTWSAHILIDSDGKAATFPRPGEEKGNSTGATWDCKEIFNVAPRKGLTSYLLGSDNNYSVSRQYSLPNAPTAFMSRNMVWHPRHGMLVNAHGIDRVFPDSQVKEDYLLCGIKDGFWTPFSPAYLNPAQASIAGNPVGLAIDPDDDRYVWSGSNFSGMSRMNLDDPEDILHFTHPAEGNAAKLPGYVKIVDTSSAWARSCNFYAPQFDSQKRLWTAYYDPDNRDRLRFFYWEDADRKASKDAASARPWRTLDVDLPWANHNSNGLYVLTSSVNRNMMIFAGSSGWLILDHNGTPDNTSDDKVVSFKNFIDQDGNAIPYISPNSIYEDQATGIIWIGMPDGLLYATPSSLLQGQNVLNRVKVSRNDGTSLADYLLNGVSVYAVTADSEGRKWIGSNGAGIIVTSADGKTVYGDFTSDNSNLPDNIIYDLAYNPASRSVMVSTAKGLAEFFIGGTASGESSEGMVRAYPNPVAPDYFGWVTIDGLEDNALVKIVDSKGNLVRELGRAEGGSIQWDLNNLHFSRVRTGVYYVLSSSTKEGSGEVRTGKILVMN